MGIVKTAKNTVVMSMFIPCILLIMCLYIIWIGSYEYEDEFTLGCLIVTLGIMYILAVYFMTTGHPMFGCSVMMSTLIVVISIAAVSGFKQKDGSKGSNFLCMAVTPFLLGIFFAICGASISYTSMQASMMTGNMF
ncbi:hypothetical protein YASMINEVIRUS_489 [Yasminevirus sp. GU-2018]|uniref:Uncharacterized protein n=1 Tax=Yasminevirus sp. GU-2018 TaxID=2420051 RepID=A0A5K0UAA5_9VIRU|nr:hypothetical protein YASMINEVIRUS_489 [Yasminevirus sp. GU-2018]